LDNDNLESLSSAHEEALQDFEEQRAALKICMRKLSLTDRHLLQLRYYQRVSVQDIARKINKPANFLYRRISAVFVSLHHCITRTLMSEDIL
jgi:DNA-directed RNA polymerase specialized sigma24 family protein